MVKDIKQGSISFGGESWPLNTESITCYEGRMMNEVMDLAPLTKLTNLKSLVLVSGEIEFVLPLELKSLKPLAALKQLRKLKLGHTNADDLSHLSGLKLLEELGLHASPVSDLKPLAGLTQLEILDLSCTRVSDLKPLANLKRLNRLDLSGTKVQDISVLQGLENLRWLNLPKKKPVDKSQTKALQKKYPRLSITYGNRCCDG